MKVRKTTLKLALGASCAMAVLAAASAGHAEERTFSLASARATETIPEFARQAGIQIVAPADKLRGVNTPALEGRYDSRQALAMLIEGTGLRIASDDGRTVTLVQAPQGGSAAGGSSTVEALIVTAQKREEDIQDVPIAISAFSQEDLTRSQVAGGPDLVTQVPNLTFTKTNFSGYSVQIRGIGTQAISATTDPAVAIAFNNTPFIRNRFFEQEFYDLQRVEVLRGPQGTLYGRNATAGVVNIISAKPKFFFEAKASGDISNYNSSRVEGMVNIPIVEDTVALRLAGAWTKRDGYATNEITGSPIDGRDLWSSRVSLRFAPGDRFDANLIWEHFEEDDDRLRSGKQLCKKDLVGDGDVATGGWSDMQARLSQGCALTSLYSPDAFQTPNGYRLPYYHPLGALSLPNVGGLDPYARGFQSRDLRVIESTVDPSYKARTDIVEFQVDIDLSDTLTLTSETAWASDFIFSTQDVNRFNTASGAWALPAFNTQYLYDRDILAVNEAGYAEFCDPQVGCADRLVGVDLSTAETQQFAQEFRLASNFDGPFNFNLGTNFLRYDTTEKYYVFINALSLYGTTTVPASLDYTYVVNETDNHECLQQGPNLPDPDSITSVNGCQYIDPNPIGSLNDLGHNYFLSNNPYKLISYAIFGEAYYNLTENLKITAGLRWSVDKKEAPRIPSWVLAGRTVGYPIAEVIEQEWREPTGRLVVDWKPDLSFTDETMVYASYAHGYKAGGANPPSAGIVPYGVGSVEDINILTAESATRPRTFDAEFVDAFELGSKNTLLDGRVTLNLAAFYYDYEGYQISRLVDRAAYNDNFDSEVWGGELEADWRPLENLRLGLKLGYEKTRIADGEQSIDLMDRSDGNRLDYLPDGTPFHWIIVAPFPTFTQNCVLPDYLFYYDDNLNGTETYHDLANSSGGGPGPCDVPYLFNPDEDPLTNQPYIENPPGPGYNNSGNGAFYPNYPGFNPAWAPNNGEGFYKDLGGNELPNAPNWTATISGDYTIPLAGDWLVDLHTDIHWQSESWWRLFQDHEFAKLDEYFTMNLAAIFINDEAGWNIMAYVKNVTDEGAITGAFLYTDDLGLPTNVFLTEPRLYGLRATKTWSGGPLLGSFGERHEGPYPFTVELGGQIQRHEAPNETFSPEFLDESFAPEIDPRVDQERDLDWGDGREVKLTYASASDWKASLGVRYGKTNAGGTNIRLEDEALKTCPVYPEFCQYYAYTYRQDILKSEAYQREEYVVADFLVGRDIGIGTFGEDLSSSISAGLRYAQFKSTAAVDFYGIVDWDAPDKYSAFLGMTHNRYDGLLNAKREFKGVGPSLSWEASKDLLGNDEAGHLKVDWSVTGSVLFGKQKANISGEEVSAYYKQTGTQFNNPLTPTDGPYVTPLDETRDKSVTVPTLGASLGLSYAVDRFSVGAGYRWERYYDVLDGGISEAEKVDRTIDGPYLKVSVGFGG